MNSENPGNGFWRALVLLRDDAVLSAWEQASGAGQELVRPWLTLTDQVAEEYACPSQPPCGCVHEIVRFRGSWFACCGCEPRECDPVPVSPRDLMVWRWDYPCFLSGVRNALQIQNPAGAGEGVSGPDKPLRLGSAPSGQLVFFSHASDLGHVPGWSETLQREPGAVLLTPIRAEEPRTLSLAGVLKPGKGRSFTAFIPPDELWREVSSRFGEPGIPNAGLLKDLRTTLARLRRVATPANPAPIAAALAKDVMALTEKIDQQSFRILCAVLSSGDVAKASRRLGLPDSTLRTALADWRHRGPAYATMLDLIRWRKRVGRKETVRLNEAIFRSRTPQTDYAGLLSDVLENLLEMTDENWQERTEELAAVLRPYAQQFRGSSLGGGERSGGDL